MNRVYSGRRFLVCGFLLVSNFLLFLTASMLSAPISFVARRDFIAGNGEITVTAADFNMDAILDLAIGNAFSNDVSIFLGDGRGGFQFLNNFPVIYHPFSIVARDFDGDGYVDLAVTNFGASMVSVLFGNGTGFFSPARNFNVADLNTTVVSADFNNDNIPDLAVACLGEYTPTDPNSAGNQISVLLGNGTGSFSDPQNYSVGQAPEGIDVGDFNGDNNPDLVVANLFSDSITVWLGNGDGTFSNAQELSVVPIPRPPNPCGPPTYPSAYPSTVVVGDYNNDNYDDVAVLNEGFSSISVFLGDGFGNFTGPTSYNIPLQCMNPRRIIKGDFNGDGNLDLAVAGGETNSVAILFGDGQGNFSADPTRIFPAGPLTAHVATGDFNSDGLPDIVVANKGQLYPPEQGRVGNMSIMTGDGKGNFGIFYGVGTNPSSVATGDVNGDGKMDVVVADQNSGDLRILLGDGTGGFRYAGQPTVGRSPASVAMGRFRRTGQWMDLAVANSGANTVSVLLADDRGGYATARDYTVGMNPSALVVGDFNGDNKLDLAVANRDSNTVSVLLGDGVGGFSAARTFVVGLAPVHIETGVFNSNRRLDLVVVNSGSNDISLLSNNGQWTGPTGGFAVARNFRVGSSPRSVAVGDFNGDQNLDVAVANFGSHNVTVHFGNGLGFFGDPTTLALTPTSSPVFIRSGDFNADGALDLAVTDLSGNMVRLLAGDPDPRRRGQFLSPVSFFAGLGPVSLAVGDVMGRRKPDLVFANSISSTISVLLNNPQP